MRTPHYAIRVTKKQQQQLFNLISSVIEDMRGELYTPKEADAPAIWNRGLIGDSAWVNKHNEEMIIELVRLRNIRRTVKDLRFVNKLS